MKSKLMAVFLLVIIMTTVSCSKKSESVVDDISTESNDTEEVYKENYFTVTDITFPIPEGCNSRNSDYNKNNLSMNYDYVFHGILDFNEDCHLYIDSKKIDVEDVTIEKVTEAAVLIMDTTYATKYKILSQENIKIDTLDIDAVQFRISYKNHTTDDIFNTYFYYNAHLYKVSGYKIDGVLSSNEIEVYNEFISSIEAD